MNKKEEYGLIHLSDKGIALLAAIEAGICPKIENGGHDIATFELFWEIYQEKSLKNRVNTAKYLRKVLYKEGHQTANDRAYQRKRYLKLTICSLGGLLFGSFVTKLFLLL